MGTISNVTPGLLNVACLLCHGPQNEGSPGNRAKLDSSTPSPEPHLYFLIETNIYKTSVMDVNQLLVTDHLAFK